MTEKELVSQLKELKAIKPSKEWVVLTKSQILPEESQSPVFAWKLAFAPIISAFVIIGLFGFAQYTIPGDPLFSVKKMTESLQVGFSSNAEKPKTQLMLANKRLEELGKIAEDNQVKNLGPAIVEFQASVADAARVLKEMDVNVTSSDAVILKQIVRETRKLEENKEKIEAVLGVEIGNTGELASALGNLEKGTALYLIADLETRTLNAQDAILLQEAKNAFEAEDYSLALEKLWLLSNLSAGRQDK